MKFLGTFTARLTARFAILVTLTTSAVLLTGGLLLNHQIEHGLELLHDVEAAEIGKLLGTDTRLTEDEVEQRIQHDADSDAALFLIQVIAPGEKIVFRSDNLGDTILPANGDATPHWTTRLPFLGRVRLSSYRVGPWRIMVGSSLVSGERMLRDYIRISLGLVGGVALLSVGLGYAFSRQALRPLRAIEATARKISADNLGQRIPVAGSDELASLSHLLNETFDRLQASFEQVRQFSADASHELKTPLALVRLNAEKIRQRVGGQEELRAAVDDILEEIGSLNHIIDRLLFLARSEAGAVPLQKRRIDIAAWVTGFAEDAQALAEDRGAKFRSGENASGELTLDPDLLRQLLLNLVANAVAVSPAGGAVTLESRPDGANWTLAIADEGPGLPEEQLARVFERFVRFSRDSAATAPRGHGLGLAICRAIAELHGGSIRAENRRDAHGLRVIVTLPRT
ncbi:MAG: HAMP domain-containing protein [Candidatus Didemnitutus sp.]|nr:HAMP domain-containing protein [Candidatus Didemnitutus sp.]